MSARPWTLSYGAKPQTIGLAGLAAAIKEGAVKTLVILGGNPVYNAPADLDWAALQKSVPEVVRFGYYADETSAGAGTHIAAAHYLESWGDARTADGTVVPVQPMILPLFGGLTQIELLAPIIGRTVRTRTSWSTTRSPARPAATRRRGSDKFLHDGAP